jgi:hypothetical protein
MKRRCLLPVLLVTSLLVHCSKDKKDIKDEPIPPPNIVKGLLAFFELNSFYDSTKNVTLIDYSPFVTTSLDRRYFLSSKLFDGKNGYMTIQPKNWTSSPISVSVWVGLQDSTAKKYFLTANSTRIGFVQDGKKIGFVISNPQTNSAMAEIEHANKWIHVTGTYDGKTIRTYINGKLGAEKSHSGDPEPLTVITMGLKNNVFWHGVLDDLRFYNRVITEAEIAQLSKF